MKTVYVSFDADPLKRFAYKAGALSPREGQSVVVLVGKVPDKRRKLVLCVGTSDLEDEKATTTIFGIVQEQPTNV